MTEALNLIAGKQIAQHFVEYSRGNTQIYPDSEAWYALDALTSSHPPKCSVILGRGIVKGEVETFNTTYLVGHTEEDYDNPEGVWTSRKIPEPDPFSYIW